ncbi:SMP-30/gluconolactonase/LRE family protein [Nocardioides sp. B-3]|uniref:SMP-30/gluconolactonase/LRE family protein n=1 Tax=Nocardioides sp. B-3 TaxID=2895565 RepID=UPI0021538A40|nr:strictosidine synthase family protein [Nocardioides sp. B-3]UUZ58938.1 strictosidine synthase family protein [Nocardioides sp. B-3]
MHVADGSTETLLTDSDGAKMRFCNNAAIASDGTIWFSDSSLHYGIHEWKDDFVQHTRTGRLVRRDVDGTATVVIDDLAFANGVALSSDEQFVAVAETGARTVVRWWIAGPRQGERDFLVRTCPATPDNISRGERRPDLGDHRVAEGPARRATPDRTPRDPQAGHQDPRGPPAQAEADDPGARLRRRGHPGPRHRPARHGLPHGHGRPRARRPGVDGEPARACGGGPRPDMK